MSTWFEEFGFDAIRDDRSLWLGSYPQDQKDVDALHAIGIDQVICLCEDGEYQHPDARQIVQAAYAGARIRESRILSWRDFNDPEPEVFSRAVEAVLASVSEGNRTYLHCRAGWQRSATVAVAVIAVLDDIDLLSALVELRARRPQVLPLPAQWRALEAWAATQRTEDPAQASAASIL